MTTDQPRVDWTGQLALQLSWHWENQARPRLDGLTDAEYLWEPVEGCWSLRRRDPADPSTPPGVAGFGLQGRFPPPDPAPLTTIAWRIGHLLVGVFGERNARYFGGPSVDSGSYDYPETAAAALAALDAGYATWIGGVRSLSPDDLARPCREPGYESDPMAGLVLHIHRELIHHSAEVALLRDLYLRTGAQRLDTAG